MTVSACIIAKDEKELIGGCIDSIKDVVDEIILLDTGSKDRTVRIAKEKGAIIHHWAWRDDFSKARNISIAQATSDKVFIIDADERLHPDDHSVFKEAVESDAVAVGFGVLNETPNGISMGTGHRLFRKDAIHYEGIVHNQPIFEGKEAFFPVRIQHFGYNLSPEKLAAKYERTERLLRKQIAEEGKRSFYVANLVRNLLVQKGYGSAIAEANEFDALVQVHAATYTANSYQRIIVDKINALTQIGDYRAAIDEGVEFLKYYPENLDGIYNLALAYGIDRQHEKAVKHYNRFLVLLQQMQETGQPVGITIDSWGSAGRAYYAAGTHLIEMNEPQKAVAALQRALRIDADIQYMRRYQSALAAYGFEGKPLRVLMVQPNICHRTWKTAKALSDLGHHVDLAWWTKASDSDYPYMDMSCFRKQIRVKSYEQLYRLCPLYDIIHCSNEPDAHAVMIKEFCPDAIVVADFHDPVELRHPNDPDKGANAVIANRRCDGRVYVTPEQMLVASRGYRIDATASVIIPNYISRANVSEKRLPKLSEDDGKFHAVYVGAFGLLHREMKGIFEYLASKGVVVHIQPSRDEPEYRALAAKTTGIRYYNPVPAADLIPEISQYDAGLITWNIQNSEKGFLDLAIANKLWDYVAADLPVISANTAALAHVITRYELGIVYDDISEVPERLEELRNIDNTMKEFYIEDEIPALVGLYRMLIEQRKQAKNMDPVQDGIQKINAREFTKQKIKRNERSVEYAFTLEALASMPNVERILDVGTGLTAFPAILKTCGYHVTAIDNVKDYWKKPVFNRHWAVLDIDIQKPDDLETESFDAITCISVLEHITDADAAIAGMFRLLKPGGLLMLTFPYNESEHVDNVYADPDAGYGSKNYYPCTIFNREDVNKWLVIHKAELLEQMYWQVFTESKWTMGERLPCPIMVDSVDPHDLAGLVLYKKGK